MANKASNQVALGKYVYFFRSPMDGMHDCLVSAHGDVVPGRRFNVPGGVSVRFKADYGRPVTHHQGPIRSFMTGNALDFDRNNTFNGPTSALDQVLGKGLGTHWRDPTKRDSDQYYQFIKDYQEQLVGQNKNWVPHFISIRNRTFPFANPYIWLSKVIELVRAHDQTITTFYSVACRGMGDEGDAKKAGAQAYQ